MFPRFLPRGLLLQAKREQLYALHLVPPQNGWVASRINSDVTLHRPLRHRFAADLEALPLARILVRHWLADGDISPKVAGDVLFAANELCTHAVEACPGGWCQLEAWEDDAGVRLAVTGKLSPQAPRPPAIHLAPGSEALALLQRLCDQVEVDGQGGVLARCSCRRMPANSGVTAS